MSADHVEEVEVPFALQESHTAVVVTDGTLKPEIRPGVVLVFEKTTSPVEEAPLLVGKIGTDDQFAVRRFDPDGDEGHGTFVDRRSVLKELMRSEWEVRGVLVAMTARGGLVV